MTNSFLTIAQQLFIDGIVALPASRKDKRPLVGRNWPAQAAAMTAERLAQLPWQGCDALAIATGAPSGNLFMLDFDDHAAAFSDWRKAISQDVFSRLVIETTQHGGRHCYWRSAGAQGARAAKFAYAPDGQQIWIESRCDGGVSIAAPTLGYALTQGDFAHVPELSIDEHRALLTAAIALDQSPVKPEPCAGSVAASSDGNRPGDLFNRRGLDDFRRMLESHGWQRIGGSGANEHWRRPGKTDGGLSATFNGRTLYVFSTNAAPLEGGVGYSPFHVYALLEHGGDFSAAARALAEKGYCEKCDDIRVSDAPTPEEMAEVRRERVSDPGLLPETLCDAGGWIGEVMAHTLATSPRPNVRLAFAGALSACAHVAGLGRFADAYDTRPNLYLLALGDSGSGKNGPRKTNKLLAAAIGAGGTVIDSFGSGPGLEDCFIGNRAVLANVDEFHKLLAAMKDRNSALAQGIAATMLQLYSESDQLHVFRRLAQTRASEKSRRPQTVAEPHLSIFATGIPALTFASLSTEAMTDGLMARCVLIEAGPRGAVGTPHRADLPVRVVSEAMRVSEIGGAVDAKGGGLAGGPCVIVEETGEAAELRAELTQEADRLYEACPDNERGAADRSLYARLMEKAAKIALVLAIGDDMPSPKIEARHLQRAWGVVRHSTERMRYLAARYLFENPFDSLAKRAMRFVTESRTPITRSALLRSLHIDARSFDNLVETLLESRQLVAVPGSREGAVRYRAVAA